MNWSSKLPKQTFAFFTAPTNFNRTFGVSLDGKQLNTELDGAILWFSTNNFQLSSCLISKTLEKDIGGLSENWRDTSKHCISSAEVNEKNHRSGKFALHSC